MSVSKNEIILGNCLDVFAQIEPGTVDLVFADPPFNIGLPYNTYQDNLPYDEYIAWSERWINLCVRALKPTGSMYVAIGDEYAAEIKVALRRAGLKFRNWIVWNYTFGQNQRKKFSRCHTHILYYVKDAENFTFNADAIAVPSARQLKYNDKRAKTSGKVPDDVWDVYVRDVQAKAHELRLYPEDSELWTDSRLCGTFGERLKLPDGSAHPCQMPLSVLRRIIGVSSNKGDLVADPFCGSGTTAYAAAEMGRDYITSEMDPAYHGVAVERLKKVGA